MGRTTHMLGMILGLALLLAPRATHAQDTTSTANLRPTAAGQIAVLTLRDGSTLIGRVLEVTPTTVRFASAAGETPVPRSAVESVRVTAASAMHDGQLWPEDPSRTRLFFAPTGRMLRQGELYFADAYVFFPSLQGGVTDRFTIGGGMSLFPGLGLDAQLFYITPKVGVYASPNVNVAVGALVAGAKDLSDESPVGIGYGVATFGGEDGSVTTGIGYGFARHSTSSTALIMVGGQRRLSRSIAFVTENYAVAQSDSEIGYSGGLRFMGEKLAVDIAAVGASGASTLIPYVAFIYKW
jgi:hypothetical protein